MLVNKEVFRKAMSKFATGITLVTTLDHEGKAHGMTANSFTSVSLEPPLVLVCIAHNTNTYSYVEERGAFGINVLSGQHEHLATNFSKHPSDRRGDVDANYHLSASGVPVCQGALAFFGCRVVDSYRYGDHTIYIGQVEELETGPSQAPLVFFESKYITL